MSKKQKRRSLQSIENKLKGLLYKKEVFEHKINVAKAGANVSIAYSEALEKQLSGMKEGSLEYGKIKYELMGISLQAKDFISDFNEYEKIYRYGIEEDIKATVDEGRFSEIEFVDFQKDAKEMAEHEIYGKVVYVPDNVELPAINNDLKEYIDVLGVLQKEIKKTLGGGDVSPLKTAQLNKEMFDYQLHEQTLQKRYNKRIDYYVNEFLPRYEEDMKQCDANLDKYLGYAKMIIESGIDPQMDFMLQEYEKHKSDKQSLWLFFTGLRNRLSSIASALNREPKKMEGTEDFIKHFC